MGDRLKVDEIIVIDKYSEDFPELLKGINNCPERLFCLGNIELLHNRGIAVVGSRKTTQYGRNIAREIGAKLSSRGITVVSGMAAGIDTCAHEGALEYEGSTIAVLGCGPDICYPRINQNLKREIEHHGLIISEYPLGTGVEKYHFPLRNRIISGLCESTVVVQAGMRSGAMITAELANDQLRDVYAVPGNIDSQYNLGSNKLIKEGAIPVLTIGDLMDDLGIQNISKEEVKRIFSDIEQKIYNTLLQHGEMTVDELCLVLNETPSNIMKILVVMELKGGIFNDMGKIFIAKQ